MFIKRLLAPFVLMAFLSVAHSATYKLEFTTFTQGFLGSPYFTSDPNVPGLVAPGTLLADIVFDASPGAGVLIDDPNRFHAIFNDFDPNAGKILQVNLYNYGVGPVQYNPYSAGVPTNYMGDIIDAFTPRDGQVDATLIDIPSLLAPSQNSTPDPATGLPLPGALLFSYALSGVLTPDPDGDALLFGGIRHQGNWTISEVGAVPVPAAVWLFGTALIGLFGFGKRRKTA